MKNFTLTIFVLIAIAIETNAQIPNNGFENWVTVNGYDSLTGGVWSSTNLASAGPFYPVTKSTDTYPVGVGSYSVKIENNISLLPSYGGFGALWTGDFDYAGGPVFPITGHPTSFCGYYKFVSQNGDTLTIQLDLYYNGSWVAGTTIEGTSAVPNWTSFNLPISGYTTADSASIAIGAYNIDCFVCIPHGNSVLYLDNLSFDNLIVSAPAITDNNIMFDIYPSPACNYVTIQNEKNIKTGYVLNIYNVMGALVKTVTLEQNERRINISDLNNGVYILEIKSGNFSAKQKMIIQR